MAIQTVKSLALVAPVLLKFSTNSADDKNFVAVCHDVERYRSGFWQLWRRLQGDIGQIVEAAEAKAGLAPIEL